ncbi:MAG: hypothetical protein WA947_06370 [Phormidesmis sp.]
MPSDPKFNSHQKRDLLPTAERLAIARPHLEQTYTKYGGSSTLDGVLKEDAALRFTRVWLEMAFSADLALAVIDLVKEVSELRDVARF